MASYCRVVSDGVLRVHSISAAVSAADHGGAGFSPGGSAALVASSLKFWPAVAVSGPVH